jgi:hypothetical protein
VYVAPPTKTPNRQATAASQAGKSEEARQFTEAQAPDQDANVAPGLIGVSSLLAEATPEEAASPDSNKPGVDDAAPTPEETQLPDPETKPAGPGVAALTNAPERNSPHAPFATLYNQDNSVGSASITSQNFEPSRNGLDSQVADDFVVPANTTWEIDQVQVAYTLNGNGPVDSFNVFFYANSGTLPGSPVYTLTNQTYSNVGSDRQLVTLSTPVVLTAGTYWVSVQANLNRVPNGQWFWGNRSVQSNSKAAWRNPGNGFSTGCSNWGVRQTCVPSSDPDQLFTLYGVSYSGTPSATSTGTTPTTTPSATLTPTPNTTPCVRTWSIEESANAGETQSRLLDVSASSLVTDVWAVGYYVDEATLHYRTLIERWNGESWVKVDSPNQGSGDNILRGVTVVSPIDIWAVGSYTEPNGETKNLILHYNGIEWSITPNVPNQGTSSASLGTLITNELNAVHHSAPNEVWAVGRYVMPEVGDSYRKRYNTLVLRYNGTSWSIVASPNPDVPNSGAISNNLYGVHVRASNDVWAVGQYRTYLGSGGLDFYWRTLAMHYNGTAWTIHNVADPGAENNLRDVVALSANDVWVVGHYDGDTLIRHYDGTTWTQVDSPSPGQFSNYLYSVSAVGPNDIWAAGYYQGQVPAPFGGTYYVDRPLMLHWDGYMWRDKSGPARDDGDGTPRSNHIYGVKAIATDDVWAVGSVRSFPAEETLVEHYTGPCDPLPSGTATATPSRTSTMTATPAASNTPGPSATATPTSVAPPVETKVPVPYCVPSSPNRGSRTNVLRGVDFASPNAVWAVGSSSDATRDDETLVMKWNGLNWKTVSSPNGTSQEVNYLYDVSVISPTDIWAVGYYWNGFVGTGRYQTLTLHWDGNVWSNIVSPNVGFDYNYLYDVTAVSANDVWAVGEYINSQGATENLVLHWTGSSNRWSVVYAPGLGRLLDVDHSTANDVWATGSYVLRNTGSGWDFHTHSKGERMVSSGAVEAIAPNDVWVLDFAAHHWNGSTWTDYELPLIETEGLFYFSSTIESVSASGPNDVWAVGTYFVFGDDVFYEEPWVVRWNGTEWEQIENPVTGEESSRLNGVAAIAPDDVWAVGDRSTEFVPTKSLTVHYGEPCPPPAPSCGPDSNYVFSTATATIEPGGQDIGLHCSDCTKAIDFPFPVTIYGQQYVSATLGSNGTVQFVGASTNEDDSDCLPNDNFNTTIFGHLSSLDTEDVAGDGIYTTTLGTAPNRTFHIEWRTHWIGSSSYPINFEVVFTEGQSSFDIVYGQVSFNGSFGMVGVQRDIGSRYTVFECNQSNSLVAGRKVTFYQNAVCSDTATPTTTGTTTPTRTRTPTRTATVTGTPPATQTGLPSTSTFTPTPEHTSTATNTSVPGVTLTPTAIRTAAATATTCTMEFTDLSAEDPFYTYIQCLACRGIITGYPDGSFRSGADITRGQIAKIVSNAAGFNEDPGSQLYADVPPGSTYYAYINRLTRRGVVSGYPCPQRPGGGDECTPENPNLFRPNANATRGQLAKIVSNAAGISDPVSGQHYTDVPPNGEGSQFYTWIMRLTDKGVMGGYPCGTSDPKSGPCDPQNRPYFRPNNNVTRGQAAKRVANTFFPECQTP